MLPLLVGLGELMLPGAAFVPPGIPTPGVAPGIADRIGPGLMLPEPVLPEPMVPDVDAGRGAIVIAGLIAPPDDPVPVEPGLIEPPIAPPLFVVAPILPPAFIAVARQAYFPLPLPYCGAPFA
ncbi:MAG: hypothetical protein QOJ39_1809 [Candidatus Eremiobacteraeota bacterium]|jgi:hypothetical protein|nr:hypothetical protein [Candidatus Eremiobacteraeota bacterium]